MIGEPSDPCGNRQTRECTGPCLEFCALFTSMKPARVDDDGYILLRNAKAEFIKERAAEKGRIVEESSAEKFIAVFEVYKDEDYTTIVYDFRDDKLKIIFVEKVICVSPAINTLDEDAIGKFIKAMEDLTGDNCWLQLVRKRG